MDEQYDAIICGTGLKECILSGLLAQKGKKVLHLDRNSYYGADCASLNLTNLWEKFRPGQDPPAEFGHNRDWNVDMIPKFVMANGKLVKMLLKTTVDKYLEWKTVEGTYVYQYTKGGFFSSAGGKIFKVPGNDVEALKSSLMGLWEKKRCKNFFVYIQNVESNDKKTWGDIDIRTQPMKDVFKKFKLEDNTVDFIGHAVAMHINDDYLDEPAIETIEKVQLYIDSIGRYGEHPFLYPIYGLGGIPEGFSRFCAIHGGTYMLNKPIDEILFDSDGKVEGVKSGDEIARAPLIIADPSYVQGTTGNIKSIGKIIRSICVLDHPIPNTKDATSCQIILPQKQTGRNSDIFINMVSSAHAVCSQGLYVAMVSTLIETSDPHKEIELGLELLGDILEQFTTTSDLYAPAHDGTENNLYITQSYDPTSHFESASNDVLSIYKRIYGEDYDLTIGTEEAKQEEY
jgi:Rab GDP dissociation inhibitor